ncbi:MAG: WG repeat-containing protein [Crocinitomicaceae bacterium]|nr:WG repeat-containing protein [Crocinitomicaceae bacterium]
MTVRILLITLFLFGIGFIAYNQSDSSWLYRVSLEDDPTATGYVNAEGDTIVPIGKYTACFADTIKTYGAVYDPERKAFIGINNKDEFLFEIFFFDNGPDYVVEGLFRIVEDGKIGYANEAGEIVIVPKYSCAHPFMDGKAEVTFSCTTEKREEHSLWKSNEWFFIDKQGNKL